MRSNQSAGRDDLAFASARRGEALLDDLGSRLPRQAPPVVRDLYEGARGEMRSIVTEAAQHAISVSGNDRPLDEDIDVRTKLPSKLD